MSETSSSEHSQQEPAVGYIFYEDGYPDEPLTYLGQASPGVYRFKDSKGKITQSMTLDGYFEEPAVQS